jgi:hypothetical protein
VVKSLQNLSNDHVYQYIETVNAPAGGGRQAQPGVATGQNVLAWRLGYAEIFSHNFHRNMLFIQPQGL